MKKKKLNFLIVFIVSILIYFFSYGILKQLFFNINGEFLYFFKNRTTSKVNPNIIVVEIDDKTYNKLGFPIGRGDYIPFLENIKKGSPAVIGFDILFLDKGKDEETDKKLANKFKELGNIIIGFDIKNKDAILPYYLFNTGVAKTGYFLPTINEFTSKVYSIKPFYDLNYMGNIKRFDSFSLSILKYYYDFIYNLKGKEKISYSNGVYNFFNHKIPVNNGEFYINYTDVKKFKKLSFYDIYNGNFDLNELKDKIILVGYTAEGVKDDFLLPGIGKGETTKGVYVHANVINNILNDNYIIYFNKFIEKLISFLFIFFIVYLNVFFLKRVNLRWISLGALFLFLIIFFIYIIVFILSYKNSGIYLIPNYPFEFVSILFLSFFVSSIIKYVNEDKNKRLLSDALSAYVSSDIAREILYSSSDVNLSGENKKLTMFFSDIAGFTTISEKLSPEELVSFLRVYLGEMSHIIMDNKGFINKYEGDAIMALWGAFGTVERFGVIDACNSALLQQIKLKELNNQFEKEKKDTLSVRMGLHTGNAIIGNIGATGRKMEFTALGDSVNLASRLEGVNKFYNTNICVSENIYQDAKDLFTFRYLDIIRVKGKNIGINIYELISKIGEEGVFKENIIKDFEEGINLYKKRDFEKSLEIFTKLSSLGDEPSKIYKNRCEIFLKNPPDSNWDGIWTMDEK
ncbi:adenylate/guanylate cyclase domain-containing protein [Candidatus Gracilibacteria bacterium]|nr:adenylate/guanylate cyclase domain-containing protein [Candidatus Gracilibacteria bacterium]